MHCAPPELPSSVPMSSIMLVARLASLCRWSARAFYRQKPVPTWREQVEPETKRGSPIEVVHQAFGLN
jgi:hypothetical protein